MNGPRRLVWLALFAAAALAVSCAPVPPPPRVNTPAKAEGKDKKVEEAVAALPVASDALKARIEAALEQVQQRELKSTHSFWTVMHGILGNGPDVEILDCVTGKKLKALEYICQGGEVRGLKFIPFEEGIDVQIGPTFDGQGHQDQFLCEVAQIGMPLDHPFKVNNKDYTFENLIKYAKARASTTHRQQSVDPTAPTTGGPELSWTILALSQFYGTDLRWTNKYGEDLHFEDLVQYEVNQPVEKEAACGGTHRLFGLTWAYYLHVKTGGKTTGVWQQVADKIEEYKQKAHKFQSPDGSFSTEYLAGPGRMNDLDRRIGTTGHVLEWLSLAMTKEELQQGWVQEAANALARMILDGQGKLLDAGSLYHAAHGLHIYYERVFGDGSSWRSSVLPPPPAAAKKQEAS